MQDQDQVSAPAQDDNVAMGEASGGNQPESPGSGQTARAAAPRLHMADIMTRDFVQPKGVHANLNQMCVVVPPDTTKRLECKHILERLVFSLDMAQSIVCNHNYDTVKRLLCLNLKTLTS